MEKAIDVMLSIIVVSYNTREMTLECLRSVFRETRTTNFELIVWDNASSDGSVEAIASEFGERLQLVASEENLGFAAGNNRAIEQANGKFLLLLNPDTVVLDGAIDKLMTFATDHPDAGIWGGRTVFGDGSLNPASCWSRQTLWSLMSQAVGFSSLFRGMTLFNPEGLGGWDRSGERQVDIVSGCFLLIGHELWKKLGGFREMFFMYGEEADLCLRAHKLGCRPMVTSTATIVHYGGASEKIRADKMVRLLRAKMLLIREHFSPAMAKPGMLLFALWPYSRYWAHAVFAAIHPKYREKMQVWQQIKNRRCEWYCN